jgi:aminopeptidase
MNLNERIKFYAKLVARLGVNVTDDKYVLITCPVHVSDFGCMVAEEAYKLGAKDVIMNYYDEKFARVRYDLANPEVFKYVPEWKAESRNYYAREGCCNIAIISDDPDIFTGVESSRLLDQTIASKKAFKEYYDIMDACKLRWTVVAVPSEKWAKKVYPDADNAVELLWTAILDSARITENAVENWIEHDKTLKSRANTLNENAFKSLHFTNSLGTDFTVGLVDKHIWKGGSDKDFYGVSHFANMPTEEIFTMPDSRIADGRVYSAMPLVYQGNTIDEFWLEFKDGAVIDFDAKVGKDTLKMLLDTDENSRRLGEVALIPYDSPISKLNTLFYETLFDENASCHLALGECYPDTMEGGEKLSEDELKALGGNKSVVHVDFMIGTSDMNIDGIKNDGTVVPVFRNGNFVI